MKSQQSGFTLIELIIVIVILGILAAFALPRFADVSRNARAASIDGVAGAMRSASAIAHSAYLVGGGGTLASVTLEGTTIPLAHGYPTWAGIILAAQITEADFVTPATPGTLTAKGAVTPANCKIGYTAAAAAGDSATFAVDTSGC